MGQVKVIPKEIKQEILAKVKGGEKVMDLAKQYAVSDKSIYTWLHQETGDQIVSIVGYNKLKRENEELKKLIGALSLKLSLGEKNRVVKNGEIKSVRAEALGINRKNIYRQSKLESHDLIIKAEIITTHKDHPAYGHRRLGWHLKINAKRIRRIMKKYRIKVPRRKIKNKFCTRSIKQRKYPNLIKDVQVTYENQVWCSDTSRFIFHGTKWYIVTVIDIFTRQVLGVAIGRHHDSELVVEAIEMALARAQTAPEIFHSDQGTEFMAAVCTQLLEGQETKISASDKASPWQNGYQESFFGKFKDDVGDINRFETAGELLEALYHAIHYYNNERIHTALKMPPAVYAKQQRKSHRILSS